MDSASHENEDLNGQFVKINVSREDILNCSFSSWYPQFKKYYLSDVKIFKPLPKAFVEYLESDGIELPKHSSKDSVLFQDVMPNSDNEYSDWENGNDDDDQNVSSANNITNPKPDPTLKFKDFHDKLVDAIKEYGSVCPKLNWSSPQDATWIITGRNMRCYSTSDLFLLLKSSDYINHDLYHAFDEVTENVTDMNKVASFDLELILRKWVDVNPSMEFRCFVRDRQLIAISQRDLNFYSFLDDLKDSFTEKIGLFFDDVLLSKFNSNSFVFDVYIPKPFNRVFLIDINPFQRSTDSLLFSWNELGTMHPDEEEIIFRLVTEHNTGRFITKAHSQNHVPRDFLDASTDTQAMVDFLKKCKELELNSGDETDDEIEKK